MKKLTINRNIFEKIWVAFGSVLLLTMSLFFASIFHLFYIKYLPVTQFLLMFFLGPLSIFIIPGFFIYTSFKIHSKRFLSVFSFAVTLCWILDVFWMINGWAYGIRHQGLNFLINSIFENGILFLLLYVLISIYCKWRRVFLLHFAVLLFFITLSLFAFPWLGERM